MVISQTNPELVFNAFRLANFSWREGEEVKVFLLAEGVELDGISNPKFDVRAGAVSLVHDEGSPRADPGGGTRRDVLKNGALPWTGREQKAAR